MKVLKKMKQILLMKVQKGKLVKNNTKYIKNQKQSLRMRMIMMSSLKKAQIKKRKLIKMN